MGQAMGITVRTARHAYACVMSLNLEQQQQRVHARTRARARGQVAEDIHRICQTDRRDSRQNPTDLVHYHGSRVYSSAIDVRVRLVC